jgi:bifunctional non-homologous end joining protein LigD
MLKRHLPAGFVVPAQPVEREKPPVGARWAHEIKHDGYRLIVRKHGAAVRLFTRNGYDWSRRFPAISEAAEGLKASTFTIDGEAVVVGPDGLSRFDELRRRASARTAILYAFDLIEQNGEDLRARPFLERKEALAGLVGGGGKAGILYNDHIIAEGAVVFAHACKLGRRGSCRSGLIRPTDRVRTPHGSRCAIRRASRCSGSAARSGISEGRQRDPIGSTRRSSGALFLSLAFLLRLADALVSSG